MYAKIFVFVAILFLIPQNLSAAVHSVFRNVATVVNLQDNDEIKLLDFPDDWYFSRIVIGVNSVPALKLSGSLIVNDCIHELHDDYNEIAFVYTGDDRIIYHGPSQNLPIQWWADALSDVSPCKSYSEMVRRDSVNALLYDYVDSIYSEKIKNYIDLGYENSETIYKGISANFKIVNLPDKFYNRIVVQVESMDGHELDGFAFAGGLKKEVRGNTAQFAIIQKNVFAPVFELAFPKYRKIKIKWWTEVGVPDEIKIEAKESSLSLDSVEVEYNFGNYFEEDQSVKVVYDKRNFVDGKVPVIKKLSFNPLGPDKTKKIGRRGDVYQIQAGINPSDSIAIAIPLDSYKLGEDSVLIEHYIAEENRKVLEPADSVSGNYAYFNLKFASRRKKKSLTDFFVPFVFPTSVEDFFETTPILNTCTLSSSCRQYIDFFNTVEKGLHRGLKWTFEVLKDMTCPDVPTLVGIFESPKTPQWDPKQGNIATASVRQDAAAYLGVMGVEWLDSLEALSAPYPESCNDEIEKCAWERTKRNLDRLLVDAIFSKLFENATNVDRKYEFHLEQENGYLIEKKNRKKQLFFDDYFMTSSGLVEESAKFVLGVQKCYKTVNITGRIAQNYINFYNDMYKKNLHTNVCNKVLGLVSNVFETILNGVECADFLKTDMSILQGHEGKLIAISEAMARIALLAWLDKSNGFRDYSLLRYKVTYDGIRSWLELAGPFLDYNNIVIKAYAGLTLFEYLHYGTNENLKMLNGSLNHHYGKNGGFTEGTGYSLYVWEDVPYILAALKDVYESQNEIDNFVVSENFLNSPDYMFEFSRPVGAVGDDNRYTHYGLIPVEVDDGVTYNPDYRVWAKLKNDPKYLAMTDKYDIPFVKKKNPLLVFGYPDESLYDSNEKKLPDRGALWGDFKDGVAMITAVNDDKDTVALSMVAEKDELLIRGQAHDQQDNLSITLTSSKKGFLIQDPGYSGFSFRSKKDKFHRDVDHNVLTIAGGQNDNEPLPVSQLKKRVSGLSKDFPGIESNYFVDLFAGIMDINPKNYSLMGHGGYAASVGWQVNKPQEGIVGYTAQTTVASSVGNLGVLPVDVYNHRTIMYFGENFWVIDRPNIFGLEWHVNSPMNEWDVLERAGIKLYDDHAGKIGNLLRLPQNDSVAADSRILQNNSRYDFEKGNNGLYYLRNYYYTTLGTPTKNYVMTYIVGKDSFAIDSSNYACSSLSVQCFVNTDGTKRVVVPRFPYNFNLCTVLPNDECSGQAFSDGITLFEKTSRGEWTTRGVLDGELYAAEYGSKIPLSSVTTARTYYTYVLLDGTPVNVKYKGPYLPAIPILLLR